MSSKKDKKGKKKEKKYSSSSSSSSESDNSSRRRKERKERREKKEERKEHHKKDKLKEEIKELKKEIREEERCDDSGSDSDDYKCDNIEELVEYYKCQLLKDPNLMVGGSNAYFFGNSTADAMIPIASSLPVANKIDAYNIDWTDANSGVYVREDGVYIAFFAATTDAGAEFTAFINNVPIVSTAYGTNAGGGQLIDRFILPLRKNDNVVIRNWESGAGTIELDQSAGGLLVGTNTQFVLVKISVYPESLRDEKERYEKKDECFKISHRKRKLFDEILERLLCDPELMLRGFDVHGSFYGTAVQTVAQSAPVLFSNSVNVRDFAFTPGTGDITIVKEGVYKLFFAAMANSASQFSIYVNGTPNENTTMGTIKGAGQITLRAILNLNAKDVISVRNHDSGVAISLGLNPGGLLTGINTILTMFKVAPLPSCRKTRHESYEKYRESWNVREFIHFLKEKEHLQIFGSPAYASIYNTTPQTLKIGDPLIFSINDGVPLTKTKHIQGKPEVVVGEDGIYDVFVDSVTDQAAQYTIFVNKVPDLTTTTGNSSGAGRCIIRQFMKLCKGDVLTINNWKSVVGPVTTSLNPGSIDVSVDVTLLLFKLSPIEKQKPNVV
jgi:hypothetical protein